MNKREISRKKRHNRIRSRMNRAGSFLRIVVRRSHRNFSAQVVDDSAGRVLFSLSTSDKALKGQFSKGAGNIKCAEQFGAIFSQKAKEKGLSKIVFDRAGYLYHGRVKAFAEALRKGGLEF